MVNSVLELKTQTKPSREKDTSTDTLVATGISQGARIGLYTLIYKNTMQSSVFIYPLNYNFSIDKIKALDPNFMKITAMKVARQFKDFTVEGLEKIFLEESKPVIPFMAHTLTDLKGTKILEHSFTYAQEVYLREIISGLK